MFTVWRALTQGLTTRFCYPWWAYLLLPLGAVGVDLLWVLPRLLYAFLVRPTETWYGIICLISKLLAHVESRSA
jgi:hypothetical protein